LGQQVWPIRWLGTPLSKGPARIRPRASEYELCPAGIGSGWRWPGAGTVSAWTSTVWAGA